jgi:hypothetical protein
MLKKTFNTLLVTYLIFPFFFQSIHKVHLLLLYGSALLYAGINIKHIIKVNKSTGIVLGAVIYMCGLCALWSFVIPVILQTGDFTYLTRALLRFALSGLLWFCAFLVIYNSEDRKAIHETYLLYFVRAVAVNVCFTVACLLIPSLRIFWIGIISLTERNQELLEIAWYITRFGLQGFSGFINTYLCSVSVIAVFYIIIRRWQRGESNLFLLKYLVLSVLGTLFYGRIGLVSAIISLFLFLIYVAVFKKKMGLFIKLLLIIVPLITVLLTAAANNENIVQWYNWAVLPFVNLFTTGDFNSHSFDTLKGMYERAPSTVETILLGDGRYSVNEGYYMDVDVGFMRLVYFWGVFPTMLIYMALMCLLLKIFLLLKKRSGLFLMLLLAVNFLIFEFKGETALSHIVFCGVLLWALGAEKRHNGKNILKNSLGV